MTKEELRITVNKVTEQYLGDLERIIALYDGRENRAARVLSPFEWAGKQYPSDPDSVADQIAEDLSKLVKSLRSKG